ncbi:conserved hypothetical protein [Carnobacterium maltaromaticum]|nr:conserved hypothetical protein [Carnobacterium maltaromaticum]
MEFKKVETKESNFIIVGGIVVIGAIVAAIVC